MSTESTLSSTTTTSSLLESVVLPWLWRGSGLVFGLVALVGGMLFAKQDSLLYMPVVAGIPRKNIDNPRGCKSPAERGVPYEEFYIPCSDGVTIHAWLLLYTPQQQSQQQPHSSSPQKLPTVLFFHGNAGNIGLRLSNAVPMMQHLKSHILLVEYRGYGDSDDVPYINEAGIHQDAIAALEYCRSSLEAQRFIDSDKLYLFGRSLGGAVAFFLAQYALQHNIPISGIIVENTFTSISDMVDVIFPPFLSPIKHLILRIGWDSAHVIKKQLKGRIPILFLAGAQDQLVPHAHMLKLHQLALDAATSMGTLVQMHIIPNGTHNETWYQGGRAYWKAMVNFMQQTRALTTSSVCNSDDDAAAKGTARRSESSASSAASSQANTASSDNIPTMSSRLVDIAKETLTGKGVAATTASDDAKKNT